MRKGSVAIVPLFLAIMLLFWFIAFMGGANDNLHAVNNLENLRHLQAQLLRAAMEQRYKLETEAKASGVVLTKEELDQKVGDYINFVMAQNNVHRPANMPNTPEKPSNPETPKGNGADDANQNEASNPMGGTNNQGGMGQ